MTVECTIRTRRGAGAVTATVTCEGKNIKDCIVIRPNAKHSIHYSIYVAFTLEKVGMERKLRKSFFAFYTVTCSRK